MVKNLSKIETSSYYIISYEKSPFVNVPNPLGVWSHQITILIYMYILKN